MNEPDDPSPPEETQPRWRAPVAQLRRLAGNLRDLDLACREYFLDADIDLASITLAAVILMLPPVAYLDFTYYGLSADLLVSVGFEAALALFTALIIGIIRRRRRVQTYERAVLIWCMVIVVLAPLVDFSQPARLAENILFTILLLTAMYLTLPNRYGLTFVPAVGLTIGGLVALATVAGPMVFQQRYAFALALVMLNLAGALTVARNSRFKRAEYEAWQSERRARELFETLARTDSLTGLPNRRSFMEHAQRALARFQRYHTVFSLVIIDLDHFKTVNDSFGHQAGDETLRRFAAVLEKQKRTTDMAGRLGGEEFSLLLENAEAAGMVEMVARMREAARQMPLPAAVEGYALSFSAGVSVVRADDQSLDDVMRRADQALYRAKALGRSRTEVG